MTPRPRTLTDEAVLMAAVKAISRVGPAKLTLAAVARESGLSAATLIQRFGSKRGLLLAMARSASEGVDACFDMVRAAHRSPLAALVAAATEMTRYVGSPEEIANHLAFLQMDIADPDFHQLMVENSTRTLAGYQALLRDAIAAGELARCDTVALARVIGSLSGGSLISWAVYREGTAEAWVRADIETVLAPHRLPARAARRTVSSRRGRKRP